MEKSVKIRVKPVRTAQEKRRLSCVGLQDSGDHFAIHPPGSLLKTVSSSLVKMGSQRVGVQSLNN